MKKIIALLTATLLVTGTVAYASNVPVKEKDRKNMMHKKKKNKKHPGKKKGWSMNTHNPHHATCDNPGRPR